MNETERELGNMREVQEGILAQLKRIADSLDKIERFGVEADEKRHHIFSLGGGH